MSTLISQLNKRITFQYQAKVSDGMGGSTSTWTDLPTNSTVWAKKTAHRSNEAVQAMATTGTALYNFRIRYRTDIKSSYRIKEGNKYMNIIGPPMEVNEGIGGRYMDITAKEATA